MIPFLKKMPVKSLTLLFGASVIFTQMTIASEENEQAWFKTGKQAIIKKDWETYQTSREKLAESSLLPYLEFYYHQERIEETDPQEVLEFADKHAKEPFSNTLKIVLFRDRERQKNFQFILDNAHFANTLGLKCYLYNAQYQQSTLDLAEFQRSWESNLQLPSNCSNIEEFWLKNNHNQSLVIKKIDELIQAGRITKAKELIATLPESKQAYYNHFIDLLNDPSRLLDTTTFYPDGQALYAKVIQKWSSQNSLKAGRGLQFAKEHDLLTEQDYISLRNRIAVFQAGRNDVVAPLEKILAIPPEERDDQILQWGFRLAAKRGDYPVALALLSNLSPEAQQEDVWRYWLGRTYAEVGDHAQAKHYYELIQNNPSFYGFLAADELQHNYDGITAIANEQRQAITAGLNSRFSMGLLLAKVNEEYFSRLKWREALNNSNKEEQEVGSIVAFEEGFYNLSLQAAARARVTGGLPYRYPSAYVPIIEKYSDDFITKPIVLGLIRQESLFHEKAKSPANAHGLMQLLIPTAEKMSSNLDESERESLYNPDANIRYGVTYLHHLQESVGSCIPYILASYNAGPNNVKKWLPNDANSDMDLALWIETIPFYETRGYVKNVLSNAVIYHTLNKDPKRLSEYLNCKVPQTIPTK